MMRSLVVRGMLVGLAAGLLAFGFARLVGEPPINTAIAFEQHVAQAHGSHEEAPLVSRTVQANYGLGTGTIVYGVAFGGLFAIAFAIAYGRIGALTPRGTALWLAGLAFVACYVVPTIKYPANPPAIGQSDTIGRRTSLYLAMLLLSVLCVLVAVGVRRRLAGNLGAWNASIVAGLGYAVLMAVCFVSLPAVNEVPQVAIAGVTKAVGDAGVTFPPTVLWRFRMASLGIQAVLWATLGLGFGALAERALAAEGAGPDA
jgi:hypothetical protein